MKLTKTQFWILSFTWGLPMTFIGLLLALVMLATGHKPQIHGGSIYFEVGKNWGGMGIGPVFLIDQNPSEYRRSHEFGHAVQNCLFGPFTVFIVSIPSAIRYWYRRIRSSKGLKNETGYYDIWFEKTASDWGALNYKNWQEN